MPPSFLDNLELASPSLRNTFLRALPAKEPLNPLLESSISNEEVSSRVNPVALATGATNFIDSLNFSKFKAEFVKATAIVSVTL